jgi:PTS system nitrogen regulatory IIA component
MQLTMRDMVEIFGTSEGRLQRWIKQLGLPAQRVAGQFRFNRLEVLDWAITHRNEVERVPLEIPCDTPPNVSLADALESGGIHYRIPGDDKQAALQAVVGRLRLPEGFDRESLVKLFMAREALGSTAVGDGIAIPHARCPIVLHVPVPLLTLCFLKRPIDYHAPDGMPVRILFSVVSPTVQAHVKLLAQLSQALHDPGFRKSVVGMKTREVILREVRRLEMTEPPSEGSKPRAA